MWNVILNKSSNFKTIYSTKRIFCTNSPEITAATDIIMLPKRCFQHSSLPTRNRHKSDSSQHTMRPAMYECKLPVHGNQLGSWGYVWRDGASQVFLAGLLSTLAMHGPAAWESDVVCAQIDELYSCIHFASRSQFRLLHNLSVYNL